MKTNNLWCIAATMFAAVLLFDEGTAQNGMDHDNSNGATFHFSRLDRVANPNSNNEKAVGIYPGLSGITPLPASALEVNTDFTHFPAFLSTWYNRGEVFRTDNPLGLNTYWRMLRGGTEYFHINSDPTTNTVNMGTVQNEPFSLFTNNTERLKITGNGTVIIQDKFVLKASDGDGYFLVTVNSKGELTAVPLDAESLAVKQ